MWKPFRLSIEENARGCAIVYDKFHILQHANRAVDDVRRAEFFRQNKQMRQIVKGKRWMLLSRWEIWKKATYAEYVIPHQQNAHEGLSAERKFGSTVALSSPTGYSLSGCSAAERDSASPVINKLQGPVIP
jgi:Transposase